MKFDTPHNMFSVPQNLLMTMSSLNGNLCFYVRLTPIAH